MANEKRGMGFLSKLLVATAMLAVLVALAGGVMAKATGNPDY
jgi:hypothetical protein